MKRPVLQTKISLRMGEVAGDCHDNDIDRCVLDNQGNGYIGFSAATGGERTGVSMNEFGQTNTIHQVRSTSNDIQLNTTTLATTVSPMLVSRLPHSRLVLPNGTRLFHGNSATRWAVCQSKFALHLQTSNLM